MPELSAIALGLNGGCCFAYAVLFGVMQDKLLQMYGVEVRYPSQHASNLVPIDRATEFPTDDEPVPPTPQTIHRPT